ncbi:hypothetical protein [Sulfitobacter mediterraneus]|uniref:hypothetical protein n=1 Tax=Sulfitobacter mediterraneus TaxID=83219 RepID=UPI0021A4DDA4|nr:hypothetical protein [Sulfitobacter mediterraneus]UWR10413.1 hypothetical protein K3753_14285 [Sulfitobacter mediterraneus]
MVETHDHFVNRLEMLGEKHAKMTRGYGTKISTSGLIVIEPKEERRNWGLPVKVVSLTLLGFLGFKVFMLAAIGAETYNERLAKLENGTIIEKAGAIALSVDPLTAMLAETAVRKLK